MDALLTDYVSQDDLKHFEKRYHDQLHQGPVSTTSQFEYGWCLIRSRYPADIRKGLLLLKNLFETGDEQIKRDCLFYMAIGHTKLKEYTPALNFTKAFLSVEPENRQAQQLHAFVKMRMKKEGILGAAILGGAVLVVGGLLGAGIALIKK